MSGTIVGKIYGLARRRHEILVEGMYEADGSLKCYRPLGGTLEFGETSQDGLRREFREELGVEIDIIKLACVAEEIFEYLGKPGHQLAFIYDITIQDPAIYEADRTERIDTVHGTTTKAEWIDPDNLPAGVILVLPDLIALLKSDTAR